MGQTAGPPRRQASLAAARLDCDQARAGRIRLNNGAASFFVAKNTTAHPTFPTNSSQYSDLLLFSTTYTANVIDVAHVLCAVGYS
jgi:hypothetical protein